ncbi:MAG: Acyl dehydratase [Dehalococcoidia bacterium]|nr:Acyl dehydratase [Dehalococcoidia bacterium]
MSQTYFEEVELGQEIGPLVKLPTREQVRDYVSLSEVRLGRFTSDAAAQGEGLRGVIVPGNMSMSFLAQLLTDWVGQEGRLAKLEVNFRRMVEPGDRLECKAVVTDISVRDGRNLVVLDAYIENQRGERPIQGIAEVLLPSKT